MVPLLDDGDARVRFSAATGLVRAGDKVAVRTLIVLVEKGTPALAWQAEDVLWRIAGPEARLPALGPDADGAKCRRAWEDWWKQKGAGVDLSKLNLDEAERGITLICDVNGSRPGSDGSVWECGRDGKVTWRYDQLAGPIDAHLLPGGKLLIAEHRGNRVAERDRKGTILWETKTRSNPVSCQRLPNGNTFVATHDELLEVTRDGKSVFSRRPGQRIYSATKLRNGHIIYVHSNNAVVELDEAGKEVRSVPCPNTSIWAGVELLPNGHVLVGLYGSNKVLELDPAGKTQWEANVLTPTYPVRLRNGHTLVPSPNANRVVELDRAGKEVWSAKSEGSARPFRVRRYEIRTRSTTGCNLRRGAWPGRGSDGHQIAGPAGRPHRDREAALVRGGDRLRRPGGHPGAPEVGDLEKYQGLEADEQLLFLRHRLCGVLQRGCDRLWARNLKACQFVFVFEDPLPDATGRLTAAVAEHFQQWLLNPPVVVYTGTSTGSLRVVCGTIAAPLQALLCADLDGLLAAQADVTAWELSPRRSGA